MPTVGYASLQIVPSVRGIGNEIREQISAPVAEAGDEAAEGFAKRLTKGLALGVAAAGAVVGALVIKGVVGAMEQEQVAGKLGAQLGATGPEAQRYGHIAGQLYAHAVTEDVQGAADAIRATMSAGLIPPGATNAQIADISTKVSDLANTFELDLGESATAAGQLIRQGLVKDSGEALDVLTRAAQVLPQSMVADLPAIVTEYGTHLKRIGLDAQTSFGLMSQFVKAGGRDLDQAADVLHEFARITSEETDRATEGFKALGLNAGQMLADIGKGGPTARAALQATLDALRQVKDPAQQAQLGVALFGDMAGEAAGALWAMDPATAAAASGMDKAAGAAAGVGTALRDNAATHIEMFKRTLEEGLTQAIGGKVLPLLERGASFLNATFGPAFGQAATWITGTVVPAAGDLAREVADRLVPAITSGASWLSDHLGPAAQVAGRFVRDDLIPGAKDAAALLRDEFSPVAKNVGTFLRNDVVPAAIRVGEVLRDTVVPAVTTATVWLGQNLVPAVASLASWLTGTLVPALVSTGRWLNDNRTAVTVVAGVIGTLLLPVLITTAVTYAQTAAAAVASRTAQVTSWVATGTAAVTNAAMTVAASYSTVGGWIAAGASAVASGAQQVGAWVATGARAVWGMALQAEAAAAVVAGWVLMGVQSMIRAAQMAAAWVLAMGPVGWITAAVIALVALVIANWDTIKNATVAAWNWIWTWIKQIAGWIVDIFLNFTLVGLIIKHWDTIKNATVNAWNATLDFLRGIPGWIYNAFLNFTPIGLLIKHWDSIKATAVEKMTDLVNWMKGLPGSIASAIGNLGNLLVDKGRDVVTGLWNGISGMGGWLRDKLVSFAKSAIPGPIASALGINSPSRVMRKEIGRWIPAGIEQGVEDGRPSLARTMASLVEVPDAALPKWTTPPAVSAPAYRAPLAGPVPVAAGAAGGPALQIENYWESDSGGAQQTAMDLMVLRRGRG
ncbi:hypothetical protein ACFVFS_17265 [Kitasatospora sp. NPDC057692]|uniref:hypothetical protein n=1 Tax=Kitasatospora sp. NPDC057692 TaxID=3346215 RepID=UPI003682A4E8